MCGNFLIVSRKLHSTEVEVSATVAMVKLRASQAKQTLEGKIAVSGGGHGIANKTTNVKTQRLLT